ncbi:NAD-dependent epimerase [Aestuariirhabdus litorea]|uniref:NAD-dependent epimerase n=1 Tax=Aestuariirhabdus litorea TaxID=2528527 RepID=A0A3P3VUA2_9GAMM|nr:NAD-dependent epimerase [Aestuariirhabdus litorea]RRJ84343.1 NAD-dependent epimerase [Aestuariirhabdus litorea]RWW97566.1 SDR family NAD(P)-dependent oxidoreductase [Endozoicomonadaceae bacterium GTF-13]
MNVLVTGAAGFIGYHLCRYLLARGDQVLGIDNLNDYYDVNLKLARLKELEEGAGCERFRFIKLDVSDKAAMEQLFREGDFQRVVHLAAQAGVRYSLENPDAYISANIVGFMNVLEGCRHHSIEHLVYASSSSVYGANETLPFSERDNVDHPLSLYAATKKSNELMAHTYSSLYRLPTTGLRFFTVYGPWGRPDMALFLFTRNILAGEPIDVFNQGNHRRDFTYVDDIVEGVVRTLDDAAAPDAKWSGSDPDPSTSFAPWRVFNLGHGEPVELMTYIRTIERIVGRKAKINLLPMQPGDVPETAASVKALEAAVHYRPETGVEEGIERFVSWYRQFYGV